jgi:hypothetical protein
MRLLGFVHELEVHQIELEMQNEALLLAQSQADSATKTEELYDLLPSGYFTSIKGRCSDPNLAGSELLGKNRFVDK